MIPGVLDHQGVEGGDPLQAALCGAEVFEHHGDAVEHDHDGDDEQLEADSGGKGGGCGGELTHAVRGEPCTEGGGRQRGQRSPTQAETQEHEHQQRKEQKGAGNMRLAENQGGRRNHRNDEELISGNVAEPGAEDGHAKPGW